MKKSKENHKNTQFYTKFIFNKKLGMLLENRRRKLLGYFHVPQIGNFEIPYPFQEFLHQVFETRQI